MQEGWAQGGGAQLRGSADILCMWAGCAARRIPWGTSALLQTPPLWSSWLPFAASDALLLCCHVAYVYAAPELFCISFERQPATRRSPVLGSAPYRRHILFSSGCSAMLGSKAGFLAP
eukprot:jgi/Botrbrau1/20276/Bobra.31_1s0059.1